MLLSEQSLRVKNRMREIRTSGSVRGGDGNTPACSACSHDDECAAACRRTEITCSKIVARLRNLFLDLGCRLRAQPGAA
jgi:hypothetical protein